MPNLKLFSWNVNGLRAGLKKGTFVNFIETQSPDILCLQETKAKAEQVILDLPDYTEYWSSAERPGYSGTAIFTKNSSPISPMTITTTFTDSIIDQHHLCGDQYGSPLTEGRLQIADFGQFYLVNTYVPNSKPNLTRLKLRETSWDPALLSQLQLLEQTKPVIICGDFNAAHTEIDLARPAQNVHNAGFTPEERRGITNLLSAGFIDTFRSLHPGEQRYTWWSHRGRAREHNIGWRIDYFFISKSLLSQLKSAEIYETIPGSDHCPISITLEF